MRRPRGWLARALGVATAGLVLLLAPASPASAHGAHAPNATNYHTKVTGMAPPIDGVTVVAIEAGTGLKLINHSGRTVRVLGYDGEPYLEVRPDGAYQNLNSPATYLNVDTTGAGRVPEHADPDASPAWQRVNQAPVARWYDHRTHWMAASLPPAVAGDPDAHARVLDWSVPLRVDGQEVQLTGTLDWVPPPSPWPWWAAAVLCAAVVGPLGLAARRRAARMVTTAVAITSGMAAVGYAVAREIDAGATGAGEVLVWLATGMLWPVLAGLAGIAAGIYLLVATRSGHPSEAAALALAVAGACLAIFAGLADVAVFARAIPPVPFDPMVARLMVLVVLAGGMGMTAAGALTLRRLRMTAGS
jgi:hypothetical protein